MGGSYLDTSFLVSLYLPELHSAAAYRIFRHASAPLWITGFSELEFLNALEMRIFRKEMMKEQARVVFRQFEQDILASTFQVRPFPAGAFETGMRLALQHTAAVGVRTLDLLHVAVASMLGAENLLSFDHNQRKLAKEVGLKVHPRSLPGA